MENSLVVKERRQQNTRWWVINEYFKRRIQYCNGVEVSNDTEIVTVRTYRQLDILVLPTE